MLAASLACVIVCALAGFLCFFLPHLSRFRALQAQRSALERRNAALEAANTDLRRRLHRFRTDPLFVESIGRELGMARSNEYVHRLGPDSVADTESNTVSREPRP